jgi:HPt (histidine-containing phosphotransfer) domain-containing protein
VSAAQTDTTTIEIRLARLREQFMVRVITHLATLDDLADRLDAAGTAADREESRWIAHSLAGAGGTFGFPVVSRHAGDLEDYLATGPENAALAARLRTTVAAIRQDMAANMTSLGDQAEGSLP